MIERYRDLIIIYEKDTAYVISCDSLGAIGNKEHDQLKVSEDIVGRATIKVALAEALCVGATPIVVSDTLSVEMNPTGRKIINAIEDELIKNNLSHVLVTGSTEENFPSSMTGIGITVISRGKISDLKVKKTKKDMHVCLLGYPLVGDEVINSKDVLQLKDYVSISKCKEIIEAIPVGSKGIKYELGTLERISGLKVAIDPSLHIDLLKSGGPATSCILVCKKKDIPIINNITDKPFTYIGKLY